MPNAPLRSDQFVFLNTPFDKDYEEIFVGLIVGLFAIGRIPKCVLEIPDGGAGRLQRILELIQSCPISIHDLSRVEPPARFNMPFELGMAVALSKLKNKHQFFLLEKEAYRIQTTLSDFNGIDPWIHRGTSKGVICAILSQLGSPRGNPKAQKVFDVFEKIWKTVPVLKKQFGEELIFSRGIFLELSGTAWMLSKKMGFIPDDEGLKSLQVRKRRK